MRPWRGCVRFVFEYEDRQQLNALDGDLSNPCKPVEDLSRSCPLLLVLIVVSAISCF